MITVPSPSLTPPPPMLSGLWSTRCWPPAPASHRDHFPPPLPPSHTPRAVVNSLLAAGSGIALNLKKDSKAADTSPVTVKIGDEEHTGGGTTEE